MSFGLHQQDCTCKASEFYNAICYTRLSESICASENTVTFSLVAFLNEPGQIQADVNSSERGRRR